MSRPVLNYTELKGFQAWKAEWQSGQPFTLKDYLYANGNLDLAVAFVEYFWPKVIEHEDCYFLSLQYSNEVFFKLEKALEE